MERYDMDSEEFNKISFALEEHHLLFYRMWALGKPVFNPSIQTAQVGFDKSGSCISIEISPKFWDEQSFTQKKFVVCHEFKHVLNRHGQRASKLTNKLDRDLANIAMDICVNEDLVDRFGFIRSEIDPNNEYIWADKIAVRLGLATLATDKAYEYYYDLLKQLPPEEQQSLVDSNGTLDDHSTLGGPGEEKGLMEYLAKVAGELSKSEMLEVLEALNNDKDTAYGTAGGGSSFRIKVPPIAPKKKWETIIKKWAKRTMILSPKEVQSWVLPNRRLAAIRSDLSMPSDMEMDSNRSSVKKIKVWFFLDTSASCIAFKERFFIAALSLPKERFDIDLFCFDTKVYPTTLKSRQIFGGGGTRLDIIEDYISKHTVSDKYPDAIFVITDADGAPVKPSRPERWYWFLVDNVFCRPELVPAKCNKFMLKDYE